MDERTTVQAGARARVNGAAKQWLSLAAVVLGVAVIAVPAAPASAEDELCGVEVCVGCDSSGPFEFSAGPDQYVADGSAVQLAGVASGSDQVCVDPGPAVWSQVGGQSVTLSDTSSLTPTFTAPEVEFFGETLTFRLTYADHTDDVDITINDDDPLEVLTGCEGPPFQLSAGPDQTVDEGTPVQLAGVAQGAFACVSTQPAVWTQVDGPTVSLTNDYLVPTFTAPQVTDPTVLTFRLTYEGETDDVLITVTDVPAVDTTPTTAAPTTTTTTATTSVEATPKAAETTSTTAAAVLAAQASAPLPRTGVTVTWTVAVGVLLILLGAGSLASAPHVTARSRPRLR